MEASDVSERSSTGCSCARCQAHATGQFGPYSPRQFMNLFGVVNEPVPVEVDPALAALGIEVDASLERRERAFEEWQDAVIAQARPGTGRGIRIGRDGMPVAAGAAEQAKARDAAADVAAARAVLAEEDERLRGARVAYNALARRLSDRRIAEEYAADQAEVAAQREARRAAAQPPGMLTRLARIRSKVVG